MTKNSTYYIKDNIIFSKQTEPYEIPPSIDDIKLPTETKNHLTNNKIIITDLDKISQKKGKELEISKPIENYNQTKEQIEKSDKKTKPEHDNYDFLEKTSALQIVEGIISSFSDEKETLLKEKISAYINHTKEIEKEKNASLDEQIQIEKTKLSKTLKEKEKYEKENTEKLEIQITKSENNISKLSQEKQILDNKIESSKTKSISENAQKLYKKIEDMNHEAKNNELEINILKAKMTSLKSEIRLGKTKCINWILFILTLGLIYWTKYSDCRYNVLMLDQKINKLKEKNIIMEKKKYNLQKQIEDASHKDNTNSVNSAREVEKIALRIEELEIAIKTEQNKINELKSELKTKQKEISGYDKEIDKFENKIIELESIKQEFNKYSCDKILSKLDFIIKSNKQKIKEIEELKQTLESQKTKITGEWIIEI
jgi:chromosome segregation ATPase